MAATTTTIYYAGLGGSLAQMAPYVAAGRCFVLPDGSYADCKASVQLDDGVGLSAPYTGQLPDASDVEPYDMYAARACHPRSCGRWLATLPYRWVLWAKTHVESTLNVVAPLPWRYNIGQASDRAHALAYTRQAMASSSSPQTFVLFGRSRGSAVCLDVFVMLSDAERARVSLVLLEGTFLHSEDVITSRAASSVTAAATMAVLRRATEWRGGRERETAVFSDGRLEHALATSSCPIAIVTSRADRAVPEVNAHALTARLQTAGLAADRLRVCVLAQAEHSTYPTHNAADSATYSAFLRSLGCTHTHVL